MSNLVAMCAADFFANSKNLKRVASSPWPAMVNTYYLYYQSNTLLHGTAPHLKMGLNIKKYEKILIREITRRGTDSRPPLGARGPLRTNVRGRHSTSSKA